MCGLTGVFGTDIKAPEVAAFMKLAQLSSLRGGDGAGFFDYRKIDKSSSIYHKKSLKNAGAYFSEDNDWMDDVVYSRYLQGKRGWHYPLVLAAHARAATIGKVTERNSHPFKANHILGMHNGTIHSDFTNKANFETDSEAVFALIAEKGEEAALDEINNLLNSAFALTWINSKDHSFNICRNSQRPLFYVEDPLDDTTYYSSDGGFLQAVLPYFKLNIHPKTLPSGVHFKFPLNNKKIKRDRKERKLFVKPPPSYGWFRGKDSEVVPFEVLESKPNKNSSHFLDFKPYRVKIVVDRKKEEGRKLETIESFKQVSETVKYTFTEYEKVIKEGCSGCRKVPMHYQPAHFFQDGITFLCEDCVKDEELVSYVSTETVLDLDSKALILQ